jgi:hypothetical protein
MLIERFRSVPAVLGAALAIRVDLFNEIGGFREVVLEDVEICLRVRSLGYDVVVQPRSEILHYTSATLFGPDQDKITNYPKLPFDPVVLSQLKDEDAQYQEDGVSAVWSSEQCVAITDSRDPTHEMLREAQLLSTREQFEEACALLLSSLPYGDSRVAFLLGSLSGAQHKFDEALDAFRRLLVLPFRHYEGADLGLKIAYISNSRSWIVQYESILRDMVNRGCKRPIARD